MIALLILVHQPAIRKRLALVSCQHSVLQISTSSHKLISGNGFEWEFLFTCLLIRTAHSATTQSFLAPGGKMWSLCCTCCEGLHLQHKHDPSPPQPQEEEEEEEEGLSAVVVSGLGEKASRMLSSAINITDSCRCQSGLSR